MLCGLSEIFTSFCSIEQWFDDDLHDYGWSLVDQLNLSMHQEWSWCSDGLQLFSMIWSMVFMIDCDQFDHWSTISTPESDKIWNKYKKGLNFKTYDNNIPQSDQQSDHQSDWSHTDCRINQSIPHLISWFWSMIGLADSTMTIRFK